MVIKDKIILGDISLETLTAGNVSGHYADWLNDPELTQFTESRFQEHTAENALAFAEACNARDNTVLLGIFADGQHIGNIKADLNTHHMTAGIGILIGVKNMHSRGIGTQAINGICDYLFSHLNIYKINAGAYASNTGSLKAFQKAGFELEYVKKSHVINHTGDREDVNVMVRYAAV